MATAPTDDAFAFLEYMLQQWDLGSLSSLVKTLLQDGVPQEVVPLKLRETKEYKERFKANEIRKSKGLQVLSEAELVATETALKSVVRRYVGSGTYDTREFTDKWLGGDVSAQELTDRMNLYSDNYERTSNEFKQYWTGRGLTRADAIRAAMDPSVTEQTLRRKMTGFSIASEAFGQYGADRFGDSSLEKFEQFADAGVSQQEAQRGFGAVAAREKRDSMLASLSGKTLSRDEQEREELLQDASAKKKREKIYAEEEGRFDQNFLGGETSLRREAKGSY